MSINNNNNESVNVKNQVYKWILNFIKLFKRINETRIDTVTFKN